MGESIADFARGGGENCRGGGIWILRCCPPGESRGDSYADLANAPSIMATAFGTP
jgi:hypothetical protein